MEATIDKEMLRKSLTQLVSTDPDFVGALLSEVNDLLKETKKQRLAKIIQEDFDEYGDVFKALA
ncbi:hypothetical protein F5984_06655 [Rudanella paleaurantiibacter]|uniref:Uncharacterized protein n=1 Tax=Rudanella paleaurantiibacter TaxID=2614655 RepID=A0A7J5U2P2_9BACT|nr:MULTISPECIES: hypothetical protein [Rudanella]KAB7731898.1 hypothetical protein F5984_06655 [Rudanella paleaurantiibacter]